MRLVIYRENFKNNNYNRWEEEDKKDYLAKIKDILNDFIENNEVLNVK